MLSENCARTRLQSKRQHADLKSAGLRERYLGVNLSAREKDTELRIRNWSLTFILCGVDVRYFFVTREHSVLGGI